MRTLGATFLEQLAAAVSQPALFFALETASTTLRYCTCGRDTTLDGHVYLGDGTLLLPDTYKEQADSESEGLEVRLVGEPQALVSLALQDLRPGKIGTLTLAFIGDNMAVLDWHVKFVGRLDECELADSIDNATLSLRFVSRLTNSRRDREYRYNDATQQAFYAGDRGFEYMEQLAANPWRAYWGRPQAK